ncbi:MAG: D-ribose pyranase [Acidobacteriaceae bacterium]
MLKTGILNPAINALLSRVRHTNTLVIADRGFPSWPDLETIDIALIDDMPRVVDVLRAVLINFHAGKAYMAEEFFAHNSPQIRAALDEVLQRIPLVREPHVEFKRRIPLATGLIRTGDTTQYANIILESA